MKTLALILALFAAQANAAIVQDAQVNKHYYPGEPGIIDYVDVICVAWTSQPFSDWITVYSFTNRCVLVRATGMEFHDFGLVDSGPIQSGGTYLNNNHVDYCIENPQWKVRVSVLVNLYGPTQYQEDFSGLQPGFCFC